MKVKDEMAHLLQAHFSPEVLEIRDDSLAHKGHREGGEGQESHFSLVMISDAFEGKTLLERHREVQRVLKPLLSSRVHALSLKLFTPAEKSP